MTVTGNLQDLSSRPTTKNPAKREPEEEWVAVGIGIAPHPPHGSVRALVSAYGSYLGYERQSVAPAKDAAVAVVEAISPTGGASVPNSADACGSGAAIAVARVG